MSIPTPPAPRKSGCGAIACGGLLLIAAIVVVFVALVVIF